MILSQQKNSHKSNHKFLTFTHFLYNMSKPAFNKSQQQDIAKERIKILFEEAEKTFSKNKNLANRYVTLARKIAMKTKTKIPPELKRKFCKHCYSYLQPGINSRTRTRNGKVIISCLDCKNFMRIELKKKNEQTKNIPGRKSKSKI